jgi:hypothetical protein
MSLEVVVVTKHIDGFVAISLHREDRQRDENHHDDELSHKKRRLGLCRQRFQGGHLWKSCAINTKTFRVQRDRCRDHISGPLAAVLATGISRRKEYGRRQNAMKREEEAVDTDKQRRHHKEPSPTIPGPSLQNIPNRTINPERTPMRLSTCTVVNGDALKPEITRHPAFSLSHRNRGSWLSEAAYFATGRVQPRKTELPSTTVLLAA